MPRGRPREFDRDKALQDAMLVFWGNGYHAASIPDLCQSMGITTTSLYAAFGNKEKLYIEAIDLYMRASQELLWTHLEKTKSAREGLRNLLLATVDVMTDNSTHPVGCWTTLAQVDEDMPTAVAAAIRKARSDWLDVMRAHAAAAVEAGELPASSDVASLGRFYTGMVQAIGVQAHDGATKAELDRLVDVAIAVWPEPATPGRPN